MIALTMRGVSKMNFCEGRRRGSPRGVVMSVRMITSTVVCPARAVHPLGTVSYCVQKPTAITDAQSGVVER